MKTMLIASALSGLVVGCAATKKEVGEPIGTEPTPLVFKNPPAESSSAESPRRLLILCQ